MKTYQSHKEVQAGKIAAAEWNGDRSLTVSTVDGDLLHIDRNPADRFSRMSEDDPGYYVEYADGYVSWSPSKAFEDGYTIVEG